MNDYSDNVLKFSNHLFGAIVGGSKTQTSRFGQRNYKLGEGTAKALDGRQIRIEILSIVYKYVGELSDNDAIAEGYANVQVLIDVLKGIYPDITNDDAITLVNFETMGEVY